MAACGEMAGNTGTAARRVALVRYRSDASWAADHDVHLLPLVARVTSGTNDASAICGAPLRLSDVETVVPGAGVWCTICVLTQLTGSRGPSRSTPAGIDGRAQCREAAAGYRALGWPTAVQPGRVSLNLDLEIDAVALVIPAALGADVVDILVRRRCTPAVLSHPALPDHRIVLAGERYGAPLPWPTGVHRVTGTLVLRPPSPRTGRSAGCDHHSPTRCGCAGSSRCAPRCAPPRQDRRTLLHQHIPDRPPGGTMTSNPLSSAALRLELPAQTTEPRPFVLRFARHVERPPRPDYHYSPEQQIALDPQGRPLIETMEKDWLTKRHSDGAEGVEEEYDWEEL